MRRELIPIYLVILVDIFGLTLIIPILPFFAQRLGASPLMVGLLSSVYSICMFLSGPVFGRWSDRFGRKPMLLLSQVGTFLGFLMLAFSGNLYWVFVSRALDGLTAGNLSIAQAYIADRTTAENRSRSFAMIGVCFGIGFLFGPAISGFLAQFHFQYPIFLAAFLSAVSVIATQFLLPKEKRKQQSVEVKSSRLVLDLIRYFRQPTLRRYLIQYFLFSFAFSVFASGFALFAERRFVTTQGLPFGPREVGYLFALSGALGILIQGVLMNHLVNRFGERALSRAGFFLLFLSYATLAPAHGYFLMILSNIFGSMGSAILRPTLTSLISHEAPVGEQGVIMGTAQSLLAFAQILGPILGGILIHHEALSGWASVSAFFSFLALLL